MRRGLGMSFLDVDGVAKTFGVVGRKATIEADSRID